jgi:RNA polymerase sigma-70 factor (ECF subfamily)
MRLPSSTFESYCDEKGEDERLIVAIRTRRPEALEQIYARFESYLRTIAQSILGSPDEAKDCVHDVLLRIWQRAEHGYDIAKGSLSGYLATCVRHDAITRKRKSTRRYELDALMLQRDAPTSTGFELTDHIEVERLRKAVATLPAEQRAVVHLVYDLRLSHRQIANRLGLPLGTIKSRLALALRKLDRALRPPIT